MILSIGRCRVHQTADWLQGKKFFLQVVAHAAVGRQSGVAISRIRYWSLVAKLFIS